ncbi:MAG: exopolysaccharide biosynthesis polyprenyl glycosylphosphotransferase [Syntrophobacterales bacterium]
MADIFTVAISLSLAMIITDLFRTSRVFDNFTRVFIIYVTLIMIIIFFYYVFALYDIALFHRKKLIFICACIALLVATIFFSFISYFIISLRPGRSTLFLFYFIELFMTISSRFIFHKYIFIEPYDIVFLGNDVIINEIKDIIVDSQSKYYNLIIDINDINNKKNIEYLFDIINKTNTILVIYSTHPSIIREIASLILELQFLKVPTYSASDFYQRLTGKLPIDHLDDFWMVISSQKEFLFPKFNENLKRVFDLTICLVLMPAILILIIISALAIKLTSKGRVFFIQERLGRNEVPFRLIKLRTMVADAEKLSGPQWASDNDQRVTKLGKILRKLRFDELPQFLNVIKGEMSIIGPRPIRKYFVDKLSKEIPYYRLRLLAKPGITGWAQVCFGHANTGEGHAEMVKYDLYYLINQSVLLDIFILVKTLQTVLWSRGR